MVLIIYFLNIYLDFFFLIGSVVFSVDSLCVGLESKFCLCFSGFAFVCYDMLMAFIYY